MSDAIIKVENVSKRYVIGHQRAKGDGLRHAIEMALRNPLRWLKARKTSRGEMSEDFWALKDVSFEIKRGDVVGIVGRNGAGKSTLLKILSRITRPTSGRIHLKGRVASLLEVGTGFHQELTGRENVFLNGAILGMSRAEIRRKFDEIVDFSGVEKFLDTPVKRYSSGMYVRLAFAVAAHLEPEILIVDEVLAVGDAEFQKKCLGKMGESASSGRTVLFVSHNMQAMSTLCGSGVFLEQGKVVYQGNIRNTIDCYLTKSSGVTEAQDPDRRLGSGDYRFLDAKPEREYFDGAESKTIIFGFRRRRKAVGKLWLSIHIVNSDGVIIVQCDSRLLGITLDDCEQYFGRFRFTTPWLKPGSYRVDLVLCAGGILVDFWEAACSLNISPILPYTHSLSEDGTKFGIVFGDFAWDKIDRPD